MNEPDQVDLCIAIVDYLNSGDVQTAVPIRFNAVHSTKALIDNPQAGRTYVVVFPGDRTNDRFGRTSFEQTATVTIGIVERINTRTPDDTLARELLLRRLHEYVERCMMAAKFPPFDRNEEGGQVLSPVYNSELYDAKTFTADIPNTYTYKTAIPSH